MLTAKNTLICAVIMLFASVALLSGCASSSDTAESSSQTTDVSEPTISSTELESDRPERGDSMDPSPRPATVSVAIGAMDFAIDLADNETASAFVDLLPLKASMSELNGNEKYLYLDAPLPTNPVNPGTIEAGDVMLYGNNCLVVFYESHPTTYRYTRIGKINDAERLAESIGNASVEMSFRV